MLLKWKASAKTGEGIYILQSVILYRNAVLKVMLNRIVNLPDTGYLPDTRYQAGTALVIFIGRLKLPVANVLQLVGIDSSHID